jgi:hypothetical protein
MLNLLDLQYNRWLIKFDPTLELASINFWKYSLDLEGKKKSFYKKPLDPNKRQGVFEKQNALLTTISIFYVYLIHD